MFDQVINKWLALQAMSDIAGNVKHVRSLLEHPAFDIRNPNKVCLLPCDWQILGLSDNYFD